MKNIAIVAALLLSALTMNAQTTTVEIIVEEDTLTTKAPVTISDGKLHFDFDVPFYDRITGRCDDGFELHLLGLGAIKANSPSPFDFSTPNSIEVFCYGTDDIRLGNHFQFDYGMGFDWKNLTMTGVQCMTKDTDGSIAVVDYPENAIPKLSRLRIFSIGFPLLLSCDVTNGFGFSMGPIVNLNTSSCINTKYTVGSTKQKDKYKNVHCNLATVDLFFELNLKEVGLWVKYSPMNAMDKSYWPEIQTLSFGISI